MSRQEQLVETWKKEEQYPFRGWDFSYLDGRMLEESPPWSYFSQVITLMQQASSVVDLGTGGGERLGELRSHWPQKVVATEEYPPNFKLATERLAPYGAQVVKAALSDFDPLPFSDGEFALVLNRHSAFNPGEVARVLAPGGTFLTQQVHGMWAHDLLAVFEATPQWPEATPEKYIPQLNEAGLTIIKSEAWAGKMAFTDVGAIVYYLKAVPWLVPGFSVASHLESLFRLQERLESGVALSFEIGKYLIEARKR